MARRKKRRGLAVAGKKVLHGCAVKLGRKGGRAKKRRR